VADACVGAVWRDGTERFIKVATRSVGSVAPGWRATSLLLAAGFGDGCWLACECVPGRVLNPPFIWAR